MIRSALRAAWSHRATLGELALLGFSIAAHLADEGALSNAIREVLMR